MRYLIRSILVTIATVIYMLFQIFLLFKTRQYERDSENDSG